MAYTCLPRPTAARGSSRSRAAFALALAFLLLAGCGTSRSISRHRSDAQFAFRDEAREWSLPVHPNAERLEFSLEVLLTSGAASWVLTDPEGEVRWEGTAEPGRRVRETRSYSPLEGDWRLTLALDKAGGRYEWLWTASWVNR